MIFYMAGNAVDFGLIGINFDVFYECRIHEGQDSSFFPLKDIFSIYQLYYKIARDHSNKELLDQIKFTYTNIILSRFKSRIIKKDKKYDIYSTMKGLFKSYFSLKLSIKLIKNKKYDK